MAVLTAAHVLEVARECIGTPFRHQGRLIGSGLDCVGIAVHVVQRLGLEYQDMTGYPRLPYKGLLKQVLDAQPCLEPVPKNRIAPADFLLMTFHKHPQHLAIYTGRNIIHSWYFINRVAEHRMDDAWRRRIVAAYRIKGLAHG